MAMHLQWSTIREAENESSTPTSEPYNKRIHEAQQIVKRTKENGDCGCVTN